MYERGLQVLRERGYTTGRDRIRTIVIVDVLDAAPLVSPAYDAGATERDLTRRWLAHHTALHRDDG
jgi:hypothetical protein